MKLQFLVFLTLAVFACEGFGGGQGLQVNLFSPFSIIRQFFCGRGLVTLAKFFFSFGNPLLGSLIGGTVRGLQGMVCPVPIIQPRLPGFNYYRY